MITDKEISEYRSLCTALWELHEEYLNRKRELCLLLEKTEALRKDALLVLVKANRLTRHLTGRQRQASGLIYQLDDIKARMNQSIPALFRGTGGEEAELLPGLTNWQSCDFQSREDCLTVRELRQRELLILGMIDAVRKKLLQLDLLELRCRELILSVNKALEAFRHESRIINRKIYPLGIFSHFYRTLRGLWGMTHFSRRDMKEIAALGNVTGCILKIADSPII